MKLILKELRETLICLKIIQKSKTYKNEQMVIKAKAENNELVSIFVKSIETVSKRLNIKRE